MNKGQDFTYEQQLLDFQERCTGKKIRHCGIVYACQRVERFTAHRIKFHTDKGLRVWELADIVGLEVLEQAPLNVQKKASPAVDEPKLIGMTVRQKIEKAKEMLETRTHNVTEIASKLNFSNASHFSTQFRNIAGMTPTEYQRKQAFAKMAKTARMP